MTRIWNRRERRERRPNVGVANRAPGNEMERHTKCERKLILGRGRKGRALSRVKCYVISATNGDEGKL